MEYIPGGDLGSLIHLRGHLSEQYVNVMARQLLSALKYLHGIGITHRDVKPDNIMIYNFDPFHVKLTDFGLSEMVDNKETFLRTFCGTLLYCAPEVYSEYREYDHAGRRNPRGVSKKSLPPQRYDDAVDIWSLAGVLFYALCGSPPYPVKNGTTYQERLNHIMTQPLDIRPLQQLHVSESGIKFVRSMLHTRPEHRATIEDLENSSWLGGGGSIEISIDDDEDDMIGDGAIDPQTSSRVLGPEHPDTLTSMANLASTYRSQGRWDEAEELEVQVIEMRKRKVRLTGTSKMSNQSTWKPIRSSNEEGAGEVSGVHSESSSEAASVLSVTTSLSSRSSITGEVETLAGEEFAELLLDDEELKSMFALAIENDKIGVDKFERNFRRLLNQFSVGLKQEARIKEQNDAVYIIRSQSRFVARYVCNSIAPSKYPDRFDRFQKNSDDKPSRLLAQQAVNQYLEHSYGTPYALPEEDADSESESDSDEDFENYDTLSGLLRVQDFVVSSTAFSRFREDLRGFVRQDFMSKVNSLIRKLTKDARSDSTLERSASKLKRLGRELAFIPPNEIWLLFQESLGLSNQVKSMIEDLTHHTWDWWPLVPCRRPLSAGHARLFWNCVSSALNI